MEPLTVCVVIPTLNEAESIAGVISEIPRPLVKRVIIADGGSQDETIALAQAYGAEIVRPEQGGYGRACHEGAAMAGSDCDIVVFMDGDGADRGDLMEQLIAPIASGSHDFVIASRTRGARQKGSMSWHQILAGYLAGVGIGMFCGFRYSDMCAYRAIRTRCLTDLDMQEMTYGWNIEMQIKAAKAGLRILELPMPYRRRAGGHSKVAGSLRGSLRAGTRIILTFFRVVGSSNVRRI